MGWSPYRKTGLTHHAPQASVKGYTLVTPIAGDASYLLDMAGQIVHRWHYPDLRVFYAKLLPAGRLLVMGAARSTPQPVIDPKVAPAFEVNIRRIGGNATLLRELDWDGSAVWQYDNEAMHHDFVRLPNGNTLMPQFVELTPELARQVRGGYRDAEKMGPLISDDFVEIDPAGAEVRRVHLWELLDPRRDPICPLDRRLEWTHTNSLDVTREGDIVFSCRANSRIGIVAASGDRLAWKYGAPSLHHQHHATALENGNIQVFDNGMHRIGLPRSEVQEINPKDGSVVWQYAGNPEASFFSAHISGAERLAGGNVLVCEGSPGRVFEVTRSGEVVWEWVNPFGFRLPNGGWMTFIFRAHRYGFDYPGLAGRVLDASRYGELNRMYGLNT